MPEHCYDEQRGEKILGPPCSALVDDFEATIRYRSRRPFHLCMDTAWRSVDVWLEQSGKCRRLGPPGQLRKALGYRWPWWPLVVGGAALDAAFFRYFQVGTSA